ncbi:hypothetical protein G4V62_16560 [Bacillaceae bacterium SIJ1]|uniref:hypothetical protein n=1 Tax=Litoribacterium kuwaitense TaxID=1398745 RepID=UPI0013E9DD26|nr:hypothetical protein [Litoribacterium kuwaitense]NGP46481.1 hypothetical protein [Litoribacterium kuwaitense]
MTQFHYMDEEYITYLVYNVNWRLPDSIQKEALEELRHIHPDQVHLLLPHYGKDTWGNATQLLRELGFPRNKKAIPGLLGLCQDPRWPGFNTVCELFTSIGKETMLPYVERALAHAIEEGDEQWVDGLLQACQAFHLTVADFSQTSIREALRKKRNTEVS